MLYEEILEKLKEILMKELHVDLLDIELNSQLFNDLGADSIKMTDITMAIEEKFDFDAEDGNFWDDITQQITVDGLVKIIEKNLQ